MFKFLTNTFSALMLLAVSSATPFSVSNEAEASNYLFNCNMSFTAKGRSVRVIGGYTRAKGTGLLSCLSYTDGDITEIPVIVSMKGVGLGLGVSGFNLEGSAVNLGINKKPKSLLGKYVKISADAAVGFGIRASAAGRLSFKKGSAVISIGFTGQSGLGAGVDILDLEISKDEAKTVRVIESTKINYNSSGLHKSLKRVPVKYVRPKQAKKPKYDESYDHYYKEEGYKVSPKPHQKYSGSVRVVKVSRGDTVRIEDHKGHLVKELKIN